MLLAISRASLWSFYYRPETIRLESPWTPAFSASKGGNPRLRAAQDQGMNVVGSLVGIHGLEIHHVADHVVFVDDAVAAVHVAGHARDVQRLAGGIALQ